MTGDKDQAPPGLHEYPPFDVARARLDGLSRKQQRIATALLTQPELFAFGSVREVAARIDVNAATVLRFAQVIGYSGYQSLQAAVRQAYLQYAGLQKPLDQRLLRHSDEMLAELRAHQRRGLDGVYERLDEESLTCLCEAIEGARRVLICGDGAASTVAALFSRLLGLVGIRAEHLETGGVDRALGLKDLGVDDVVVGIALLLPFRDSVDTLRLAREAGARTVAFAPSAGSPIAREATHVVIAPGHGIALSFSVLPTVALIETVVGVLASRRPELVRRTQQALHDYYLDEGLLAPITDLG